MTSSRLLDRLQVEPGIVVTVGVTPEPIAHDPNPVPEWAVTGEGGGPYRLACYLEYLLDRKLINGKPVGLVNGKRAEFRAGKKLLKLCEGDPRLAAEVVKYTVNRTSGQVTLWRVTERVTEYLDIAVEKLRKLVCSASSSSLEKSDAQASTTKQSAHSTPT